MSGIPAWRARLISSPVHVLRGAVTASPVPDFVSVESGASTGSGSDREDDPIGPDDLTIMTRNGTVAEPESWLALTYSALSEEGGFITVRSGPPDLYAQAMNHGGHLLLEYRDGAADKHFQARDISRVAIAEALSQWMRGDRDFITDHEWHPLRL